MFVLLLFPTTYVCAGVSMAFHLFIKDGGMWHLWFCFNIQKAVSDMSGKTTSLLNKMNVCRGLWYQKGNIFGVSFWERKKNRKK